MSLRSPCSPDVGVLMYRFHLEYSGSEEEEEEGLCSVAGAGCGGGFLQPASTVGLHEEVQREGQSPDCAQLRTFGSCAAATAACRKQRAAASRGSGTMSMVQTFVLLLVFCKGNSESWLWSSVDEESTTASPTETLTTNISTTPAGPTTAAMVATNSTKEEEAEEKEDDLSGMGEAILDLGSGIHELVEAWNASGNTSGASGKARPNSTGNATTLNGQGEREGSGSGSGPPADAGSGRGSVMTALNSTSLFSDGANPGNSANANVGYGITSPVPCFPVPADWPICSAERSGSLTLPNLLNHTSVDEVGAVLAEWVWLAEKGCHPSAERFLCLLLVPGCPGQAPPPCRSFCQTLQDSCWASLEKGRLPVACHHLPDAVPEHSRPTCVSVSNWKGNRCGFECILSGQTIFNLMSRLSIACVLQRTVALACFSLFQRSWFCFMLRPE